MTTCACLSRMITKIRRWAWDLHTAAINARYAHLDVTHLPLLVSTDEAVQIISASVRRINEQAEHDAAAKDGRSA